LSGNQKLWSEYILKKKEPNIRYRTINNNLSEIYSTCLLMIIFPPKAKQFKPSPTASMPKACSIKSATLAPYFIKTKRVSAVSGKMIVGLLGEYVAME
jgi:hypothetical protein